MTIINDYHTPEHRLQPAGIKILCLDCQRKHDIEEALGLAVREGVMPPHVANDMTEQEKGAWYDRGFQKSKEDEIPF